MRKLSCLRCDAPMRFLKREKVQLGQTGWFLGDLSNLLAGSLELEIYCCPQCGKLEFFRPDDAVCADAGNGEADLSGLPQKQCPKCGKRHDFDYPKCPYCDFNYYA